MKRMNYVTILKNWIYGYDRYINRYSKDNISLSTYPDIFYLLQDDELDIGLEKAINLQSRTHSKIIRIETQVDEIEVHKNIKNGKGWFINRNWISVDNVYLLKDGLWEQLSIEDLTALSFLEDESTSWQSIKPRSLSYLPIPQACQAKCKFCFSDYSISSVKRISEKNYESLKTWLIKAKEKEAERFVLTGGGEPGLLSINELKNIFSLSSHVFDKNIMITNGIFMKKYDYHILNDLHDAGLNIFSLSLHHFDKNVNSHIMGIDTGFQHTINQMNRSHLKKRLICVLQKSGINSIQSIKDYLDFAILNHIDQVTFKELYISSIYETDYALSKKNIYSMNNRVPLEMVLKFASEFNLEQIGSLPWGSPVFKYNNLSFCAYTEPSVGWEKHNKLARSWNLMSDGKCYASLEDNKSWLSCI